MTAAPKNYLSTVRAQYEQLPYPQRNPEKEKRRLNRTFGDDLEYLNHFGFGGKMPLEGLRVLDAGAGSGDGSIYLAEQLREFGGTVLHLDMSEASIGVAKERARLRQLTNIEFLHASLLDIPTLGLEPFDYVTCTGVLHHLADPNAGLHALLSALKEDGLLKIMVYGQYGRTWVYHMQELMQHINREVDPEDFDTQLARCKQVMESLKGVEWFTALENSVNDVKSMGDVGIFDLFLHSQDRAYTIPQLYAFVESAGMQLQHYIPSPYKLDPAELPDDTPIKAMLLGMPQREQQAALEMMMGTIKKHFCFATHTPRALPVPEEESFVPCYTQMVFSLEENVRIATADQDKTTLSIKAGDRRIALPFTPVRRALLNAIDGTRTTAQVLDEAASTLKSDIPNRETLKQEFLEIYTTFHQQEWMFLRHASLPPFPALAALQARVTALHSGE